jgi:putative restriction endonuclease
MSADADDVLRKATFEFLNELRQRTGGLVTQDEIARFQFEGQPVRLIGTQTGIWRPRWLPWALSIMTVYSPSPDLRPYADDIGEDGFPRYKWRGTDPDHPDNRALRRAMEAAKPLIWFIGMAPGLFDPVFPVWLAGEEPDRHQFVLALDDVTRIGWRPALALESPFEPTRRYAEVIVRARLHQRVFRDRVLLAYGAQCALCRLRHPPLLDAAHIKEDSEGGEPIVPNGVAMCAIHHRAFDANVLGLRPDYKVEIQSEVLREHDGPTLQHALQGLHGQIMLLPRRRAEHPSRALLEERFERFLQAG